MTLRSPQPGARRGRGRRATLVVGTVALVVVAGLGLGAWGFGSHASTVIVTDTLGLTLAFAPGTPREAGSPVCTNCPVDGPTGATLWVSLWVDWACRTGTTCSADVTNLTIDAPFRLVATAPGLPVPVDASVPAPAAPGNGTWSSGWTIFAVRLVAPATAGSYALGGVLTVELAD